MLKRLTYFNLLYGTCWFVLAWKETDPSISSLVAIATVLLFNWMILKEIEGVKVTTDRNQTILRILTLVVACMSLFNCILILMTGFEEAYGFTSITFLLLLKVVFVVTISIHAIKSQKLKIAK
jgi:hypothetical protein